MWRKFVTVTRTWLQKNARKLLGMACVFMEGSIGKYFTTLSSPCSESAASIYSGIYRSYGVVGRASNISCVSDDAFLKRAFREMLNYSGDIYVRELEVK
ncbi:hypothetical protein CEXT_307221 [Caerostris extrusa]|uniref:Uncharacterized protein n=1 Tax=Caerostris extrusa TaxID=172846 RepID=A0AAV4TSN7_CAEEX|nr:hypothetical protein CEXT_307221 [Caerostris extrusa]